MNNDFLTNVSDILSRLAALFKSYNFVIDTVDIILVAVLIFALIRFFRESRALHIVKGIALLLVIYFVVNILGMQASTFLFKQVTDNILIILLVLFAPELRQGLESMGRSRSSLLRIFGINIGKTSIKKEQKLMHEVCKACVDMADKKIGAIIVLEKQSSVDDHIVKGTPVNADVSKELLGSLFFPNSPLHDGAVIIRDGKIHSAGCILPLTQETNLSSELGTRHRASLGLSEQCDAVVVVVSEERGQISIAHKGTLLRDISEGELYEKMSEYFSPSEPSKIQKKKTEKGAEEK